MKRVKGEYWKVDKETVKLQIRTTEEQAHLEEVLPGWMCISYGYAPTTSEDIYVFEKSFQTEIDWTNFLNSDKVNQTIEMKEVPND